MMHTFHVTSSCHAQFRLLLIGDVPYLRFTEDILHNRFRWDSRLGVVLTSLLVLVVYLLLTS
jgi:hypothetical protein